MNELNLLCFKFQQDMVNIFNNSQIPFLLKYYLLKQIWENAESQKFKIDMEIRSNELNKETTSEQIKLEQQ